MKTLWYPLALLFLLTCWQADSHAEPRKWEIDKGHANIYFSVDHIFATIRGQFNDFTVSISFDENDLEKSSLSCEIKTASIDTHIAKRDEHLRSADFFDAEKYPLITFQSTAIKAKGKGRYDVRGTLHVKGERHDVVFPLVLAGMKRHPAMPDKEVIGFNGVLDIDRLAFHIGDGTFYKMGMLGKDVELLVSLEALADTAK